MDNSKLSQGIHDREKRAVLQMILNNLILSW